MSKQVYIDSNGNEIQVSGTVNTADMMPMSGNDSTKVATAIGDLSTLTTTDKSSLVGAVNEVNGKIDFSSVTGSKFEIVGNRLLLILYSNTEKTNGLRIDFNGTSNVIQLATLVNGTFTVVNSIPFTHV